VPAAIQRVLVLGAYGFFGQRICARLAKNPLIELVVAGRDLNKATAAAYLHGLSAKHARALDATHPQLELQLRKLGITTLIHTAGPFQGQGYEVARACISAGCHYIDLADGRAFVKGITTLDAAARAANVSVVSGASTVPALTSAAVDRYLPEFSRLDEIDIGLTSGALIPGSATLAAVLGYCGKGFRTLENGQWTTVTGWLDTQEHLFPRPIGARLLSRCDVPDLDLLPQRYPGVKTVSFRAGFVSPAAHKFIELLARKVRDGKLRSARPFARPLGWLGRRMQPLFSGSGGMFVSLTGLSEHGDPLTLTWNLVAHDNHGPNIPCAAAIALANKIAAGAGPPPGSSPCVGMLTVDDILEPLRGLHIRAVPPLDITRLDI
jgi:hypothetical protein